jgi:nicotinate-nucleotide adenylyltransferase
VKTRSTAGRLAGAVNLGFHLEPGMRVGLYGGSFNPPHRGHAHVARTALKRLGLDRVVWLVSPQNPLKATRETRGLGARMQATAHFAKSPSMIISDAESRLGAIYTIDTVRALKARFPGVHFVWIMGADSLATFDAWRGWADLIRTLPVAVISRPGASLRSRFAPAARRFGYARRPPTQARLLADLPAPAWIYLTAPWDFTSSTALRDCA